MHTMSIFVEEYTVIMTMIMICGKSGSVPNEAQLASLPYASSSAKLTCTVYKANKYVFIYINYD